ncbi:hypothetical protein OUZ56_007384 [Daphnia magna]|uniref:CxC3 like cysteine cluster domain-containing protein n=1 Tax=Daphnia magna TaxID=35525 RepID=A0ABR0AA61_9CRUS|nr:hypothetical protein OUZ56_007384 [Daphnia magna]
MNVEDIEKSEASTEDFETLIRGCNPAEEDIGNFEATATNHDESAVPLELYLNRLQSDFEISDSEFQNTDSMQDNEDKMKKHAKRMGQIAEDWDEHWERVVEVHIGSYATLPSLCWNCKTSLTSCYIRCLCCVKTFCPECDSQFHLWNAFHQRQLLFNAELIKLRSRDFWDQNLSVVVERDVAVPCFIPPRCKSCRRFDLNATSFKCSHPACGITEEASVRNYVESGYWPGSPTRTCTLFTQTYMTHWFHTKHQIPSTAAMKYMEVSGKMSSEGGRNPVINPIMFRTASSQFSYINHMIDVDIKQDEKMRCKACVLPCMYSHFDVIFKLYRYKAARSGHFKSLYGDSVIVSDEKIEVHVAEINKLKPQKGYDNCGNSTYKAGKETTSRHRTQDETGLGSACCRHGVVLVAANLKTGENYRIVHFFQHFLWTIGYIYFCYDVICNYEKFLKDLIKVSEGHLLHGEWARMSKEMVGFLSVLHGRTHTWDCQVDNNGRWREWACASLGEEQEQVFARFAKYGLVTKHISPASRNDHLSEMIENHNKEKDDGMDYALAKRAKKIWHS